MFARTLASKPCSEATDIGSLFSWGSDFGWIYLERRLFPLFTPKALSTLGCFDLFLFRGRFEDYVFFSSIPTQKKKKSLPLLPAAIYRKEQKDFFSLCLFD